MNLFKKPVIPTEVDAAWSTEFSQLTGLSQQKMLVVARPYAAGSKEETTLSNMLKACGFDADDFAALQLNEEEIMPWPRVAETVSPKFALLLGVPPAALGITAMLPPNAAVEFGGVTFIWTGSLQHLTETETARKTLWKDILQPLFKAG